MTDLGVVEELTSPHEVAPKAVKPTPEPLKCPQCGQLFAGKLGLAKGRYNNHMKYKHGGAAAPKAAAKPRGRPPKAKAEVEEVTPKRRKPAGENLAMVVSAGAQFAARTGYVPLANALAFEAPAAGQAIDGAIAGTLVDRKIVQPLVGGAEKWEAVGACLSFPVMVQLCTVYPALRIPLEEPMRRCVEEILVLSVPTIKRKMERNRKLTEALQELGGLDPAISASADAVGDIINGFFAAPEVTADAAAAAV